MDIRNYFKVYLPYILWLTITFSITISAEELTPKIKLVRRIRNLLTDFLTEEQCIYFIDTYLEMYNNGATMEDIKNDVMTNAMDQLEDDQLLKALGAYKKASKSLGMDKLMTIGTTCINVLMNNVTPFMKQVMEKVQIMKEQNKGKNSINNNMFLMANQFFTKNRVRTIFKRIKNKIGKEDFDLAFPFLSDFMKFDLISDLM
uniref:Protein G12 n=1 Tax=Strongyloides papillosus TaxID=174720 RepID=A0A0N5BQ66_STREA